MLFIHLADTQGSKEKILKSHILFFLFFSKISVLELSLGEARSSVCLCLHSWGNAHFGSPPRERKVHFEVCFTAGFSGKIVNSSMNEVYHTGAMCEATYSHCTMVNYS